MALATPTNCMTQAENKFATAVAHSAAFQSLVRVASATAAARYVFGDRLDEPVNGESYETPELEELSHFAQVYTTGYGKVRQSSARFEPFGEMTCYVANRLGLLAAQEEVPAARERDWHNTIGALMDEIVTWLEENGGPHINRFSITEGPATNDSSRWSKDGVWQLVEFTIEWGVPG